MIGRILGVGGDEGDEPKDETDDEDEAEENPAAEPAATADDEPIDLNKASFEQLRDLGFSVTQSTQLLTYRERQGGFGLVDDLAGVPESSPSSCARSREAPRRLWPAAGRSRRR